MLALILFTIKMISKKFLGICNTSQPSIFVGRYIQPIPKDQVKKTSLLFCSPAFPPYVLSPC